MPKPPILSTAVDFGLSPLAAAASTLSFVNGHPFPGALYAFAAVCWFVSGVFGLQSLKDLIDVARIRGEITVMERVEAIHEESSR